MRVAAFKVELHLPGPQSLKGKRAVLRPVVEGVRRLGSYSVAEVARQDDWQRATIGVAIVTRDGRDLEMQITKLHRYLDSRPDVEVIEILKSELEEPE